jgi:hypothetical protein
MILNMNKLINNSIVSENSINKKIITFSLILFVFPIGILLLWKWKLWHKYLRIGVTFFILLFSRQLFVLYMIFYGYVLYPEASSILSHYCFGNGSTLILKDEYLKTSPVIIYHLKEMKDGEIRKIGMHQWEDLRLSFALNPLYIEKKNDKIIISQYINFDKTGKVVTMIGPIPIPDNIVHVFNCKPYNVKCEFDFNQTILGKISTPNFIEKYFISSHKECRNCYKRNYIKN